MNAYSAMPPSSPQAPAPASAPAPAQGRRLTALQLVFFLPWLLLASCATPGERVAQLEEVQERDRKVTDLRLTRVEERVEGVEKGLSEVRGGLSRENALNPRPRQGASPEARQGKARSTESLPASPVVTGTKSLNDVPQAAPIPYLPKNVRELVATGQPVPASPAAKPGPAVQDGAGPTPVTAPNFRTPTAAPALAALQAGSAPAAGEAPGLAPASLTSAGPAKASAGRGGAASAKGGAGSRGGTGSAAYDQALALYYKGDYDKAREAFAAFIQASPTSSLAANALYWQGECNYSQGKYDDAILLFKDVAAKYPKHAKAPASLLKAGYAYERMKDMENARFYWQLLLDDYPNSAPAALARNKIARAA